MLLSTVWGSELCYTIFFNFLYYYYIAVLLPSCYFIIERQLMVKVLNSFEFIFPWSHFIQSLVDLCECYMCYFHPWIYRHCVNSFHFIQSFTWCPTDKITDRQQKQELREKFNSTLFIKRQITTFGFILQKLQTKPNSGRVLNLQLIPVCCSLPLICYQHHLMFPRFTDNAETTSGRLRVLI